MTGRPDVYVKQGDLLPPFTVVTTDELGRTFDLSDFDTPTFKMRRYDTKDLVVDGVADIIIPTSGVLQYGWQAGDTDDWGLYEAEFQILDTAGNPLTFPNDGHYTVAIVEQIG